MTIHSIFSTLPGTFYRNAAPGLPAFVCERDPVQPNDVIGLVEAMKQYFEVNAEVKGKVVRFHADNQSLVDAGGHLADIEVT